MCCVKCTMEKSYKSLIHISFCSLSYFVNLENPDQIWYIFQNRVQLLIKYHHSWLPRCLDFRLHGFKLLVSIIKFSASYWYLFNTLQSSKMNVSVSDKSFAYSEPKAKQMMFFMFFCWFNISEKISSQIRLSLSFLVVFAHFNTRNLLFNNVFKCISTFDSNYK